MIRTLLLSTLTAALVAASAPAAPVTFDWALVDNAGNAPDPQTGFGAVAYNYAISKTEVTNAQYTEFLNAVAATDSFGGADASLYLANMGSDALGGINRSGTPGSYTYATKTNMANKPVNFVSFIDAMRFTNWLHNGQGPLGSPSGGTEAGVYTIGSGLNEIRSASAKFWIPSEDEWYKAAFHDASAGTAGVYFDYAAGSDSVPTLATANSVGDISNPGVNVVNYSVGADWNGQNGNVTTVGSAGISSASPYGTFDQNGNVGELNEAVIDSSSRGLHGGSWGNSSFFVRADGPSSINPAGGSGLVGFRVATVFELSSVPGDYNADGVVDAADYTVWRDGGSPNSSQSGYELWADNYGATAANATSNTTTHAVPEPAAALSLLLVCLGAMTRRRTGEKPASRSQT